MDRLPSYKISSLGETALIIDFGNTIDESINKLVHSLFYQLQHDPIPGMIEAVPGYSSLTIYYDILFIRNILNKQTTAFEWVSESLKRFIPKENIETGDPQILIKVPVCYEIEYAPDLGFIASQNKISHEEVIYLHTAATYHIYMLGFLPGFAYMGMVDEKISSSRKQKPVFVEAGSIGIAGKQTGIYPFRSQGGWQIIGRTPLKLFDKEKINPVLFKAGDKVQFYSITKDEFEDIKSGNA
ncbi:MAG TPA: 5-oxoprolinase subunit PxpB [Chitinophagaceae bacterium]